MGFKKTIIFEHYKVYLSFNNSPVFKTENSILFGNALSVNNPLELNLDDFVNNIKGNWLRIDFETNEVKITTDIMAGFRIYYSINDNNIIISDNYLTVVNTSGLKYRRNQYLYSYWLKHNFTPGNVTFLDELKKISPASTLTINSDKVSENSYFKDIVRESNVNLHVEKIHSDLKDTFSKLKSYSKNNVLLFSGGKDSCLLLELLKEAKVNFTPVFLKLNPSSKYSISDLEKVRKVSASKEILVDELELSLKDITTDEYDLIATQQLFDKHFSLLHYLGTKKIKEKYGNDIVIINGQSADSVLSFGPSEESLMSFFRRNIMYRPQSLISKLGTILLQLKTRKSFSLPKTREEQLFALFDEYKYCRVKERGIEEGYLNLFNQYIKGKTSFLNSYYSKEMYVKLLSFSQGADNQVVVNSARHYGLEVIMPFATSEIIYNTIRYKDESLEIKNPKYVVGYILEKYVQTNQNNEFKTQSITIENQERPIAYYQDKINRCFNDKIKKFNC